MAADAQAIIPNLLSPLQYLPTAAVVSHYEANLSALLKVLQTVAPTGRASRWRGQILDVVSRLAVQLNERGEAPLDDGEFEICWSFRSGLEHVWLTCRCVPDSAQASERRVRRDSAPMPRRRRGTSRVVLGPLPLIAARIRCIACDWRSRVCQPSCGSMTRVSWSSSERCTTGWPRRHEPVSVAP